MVIEMEPKTAKEKVKAFGRNVKNGIEDGLNWVWNHREPLIIIAPVVTAAIGVGGKALSNAQKAKVVKEEKEVKETNVWDPSTGKWVQTKKPLTTKQTIEFDERVKNGQSRIAALNEMGCLR